MIYPVKSAFYFFLVDRFSCARNDESDYQNLYNISVKSDGTQESGHEY